MLDQSFSAENFRKIFDIQNRKGIYIESSNFFKNQDIFKKSREVSNEIIQTNKDNRNNNKQLKSETDIGIKETIRKKIDTLKTKKRQLKSERNTELNKVLQEISERANAEDYLLEIVEGRVVHGKQTYEIEKMPEHFFVSKQIQWNISKTFDVKQADRKIIVNQLKLLLADGFPKIIIRTDIKSFYETIPHKKLLATIQENSLLSYSSKKNIRNMLNKYWKILVSKGVKKSTDERVGLPRGIGISAYLAELYIRYFDRKITALPYVTYYARYVDDIIVIFTPENKQETVVEDNYIEKLNEILNEKLKLNINNDKTQIVNLLNVREELNKEITYLGYKFIFDYKLIGTKIKREPLKILMSDNKLDRYKTKITLAFEDYINNKLKYADKLNNINRLLLRRIKLLTTNYRLIHRKSNVITGIFFSNEFLSDFDDLKKLDELLQEKIALIENVDNIKLIVDLKKLSFVKGFKKRTFTKFNNKIFQNGKMLKIWKNV